MNCRKGHPWEGRRDSRGFRACSACARGRLAAAAERHLVVVPLSDVPARQPLRGARSRRAFLARNPSSRLRSGRAWLKENGSVVLETPWGAEYVLEADRLRGPADLGEWLLHLVGKTWATPALLWDVVVLVGRR